jgi:hypothetical protein
MSQKQETPNFLETFTWEEFKLRLDIRFTPHHLVLQDGMELLEFTQWDERGSLATYVQGFYQMLTIVPLKDEYAHKLIFLHGLKHWVWKIVYQNINIPNTCQGLMKMVECMEEEASICPKGETSCKITQKNQASLSSENKGRNKCKWGQRKRKSPNDKEKLMGKEPLVEKLKWDLSKVSNSLKLNYKINNELWVVSWI